MTHSPALAMSRVTQHAAPLGPQLAWQLSNGGVTGVKAVRAARPLQRGEVLSVCDADSPFSRVPGRACTLAKMLFCCISAPHKTQLCDFALAPFRNCASPDEPDSFWLRLRFGFPALIQPALRRTPRRFAFFRSPSTVSTVTSSSKLATKLAPCPTRTTSLVSTCVKRLLVNKISLIPQIGLS